MQLGVSTLLLLLFATANAAAVENRIEFITLLGEKRFEGSDVCFYPADSKDGFLGKFLSTNDVRCLSADAVISLPRGLFNVFARHGSTLIDSHPALIDNENPGEPGYRSVPLELNPAATLDVSAAKSGLRDDEWLVVYLTNESRPESLASVHPVPDRESKILVPANMPFVAMVVRRGAIVRIGKPMQLRAGETMPLPSVVHWGSGRDVVALLKTDALLAPDVPPQAPHIELHNGTAEPLRPMFLLRDAGRFAESIAIFKDVPPGNHEIRLSGEGWQSDELTVSTTQAAEVVTAARPVNARLAGIVEVRASIGELATIANDVQCPGGDWTEPPNEFDEEEPSKPVATPFPTLRLLRCAEQHDCKVVREISLDQRLSDVVKRWSDVEPGSYVAELAYRWMVERSAEREVRAAKAEPLFVALRPETVTGRVRHGNSLVQALVSFEHTLSPALSDESGNYRVVVDQGPRKSRVKVRICAGGGYQYLPEAPIDKVLDIDIPKNELVVRVVDDEGRPLEKAGVVGGPLFPEGDAVYAFMPFAPTNSAGETRFFNVVKDASLELCAGHSKDYEQGCAPRFEMGDREFHRIEIRLRRQETISGKLLSQTPFVGAQIWQVSASGATVAAAIVSPAGDFLLKRTGTAGEYLVIASLSHPLAVLEFPPTGVDGPLEFQMPAQSQTVTVVLSKSSRTRYIALELAGRVIPSAALLRHQSARQRIHQIEPGQTLEIRDLGPGSLVVYTYPATLEDYPREWGAMDPVEQPIRITLPRFPVTGPIVQVE